MNQNGFKEMIAWGSYTGQGGLFLIIAGAISLGSRALTRLAKSSIKTVDDLVETTAFRYQALWSSQVIRFTTSRLRQVYGVPYEDGFDDDLPVPDVRWIKWWADYVDVMSEAATERFVEDSRSMVVEELDNRYMPEGDWHEIDLVHLGSYRAMVKLLKNGS